MLRHGPSCLDGPISGARRWWSRTSHRPVREDLVARIRRELAADTYETPEKWDAALQELLRRLEEGTASS
jgi:hypothetical protein